MPTLVSRFPILLLAALVSGWAVLPSRSEDPNPAKAPAAKPKGIPDKVLEVLEYIDKNDKPMPGYRGGSRFGNFERRLPQSDKNGKKVNYREWDVNPLVPGKNRGAERMVTGSDKSAWYTADHYETFKRIR